MDTVLARQVLNLELRQFPRILSFAIKIGDPSNVGEQGSFNTTQHRSAKATSTKLLIFNTLYCWKLWEKVRAMVGTSSFHSLPVFLLLLLLLLLSFSHFNSYQFTQVFTSFSPFRREETNHTTKTPHVSLDGVLSTSMYKSTEHKAATIRVSILIIIYIWFWIVWSVNDNQVFLCIGRRRATPRGLNKIWLKHELPFSRQFNSKILH